MLLMHINFPLRSMMVSASREGGGEAWGPWSLGPAASACPILQTHAGLGQSLVAVGLLPLLSVLEAPSAGRFGDNKL